MPKVTLVGHNDTGHGCYPPRPATKGDPFFTINGIDVHCEGHARAVHCCVNPPHPCHGGVLASGCSWFTVNDNEVGRVGDPVSCGGSVAEGTDFFTVD